MKKISLLVGIFAIYLLSACHKSAIGLRGIAGLGTSMTEGGIYVEKAKPVIKIFDAHTYFEHGKDELAIQPSSGMEIELRGGNVVGTAVHMTHRKFYPRLAKIDLPLIICSHISTETPIHQIEKEIKHDKIGCLRISIGEVNILDPKMYQYYELAAKYNIPFIFEASSCNGNDKSQNFKLNELAKAFPKVNFIVSHMGGKWRKETLAAIETNDNVYVDTSVCENVALMNGNEVREKVLENLIPFLRHPKKLLFGSGWPNTNIPKLVDAMASVIPEPLWHTIFYKNGYNLFVLKKKSMN